jgi:hypothetical protein
VKPFFCCFLFFSLIAACSAQVTKIPALIYLRKGETVQGKIPSDFIKNGKVRVYFETRKRLYSLRKIDSIYANGKMYPVYRSSNGPQLLEPLEIGKVKLYRSRFE